MAVEGRQLDRDDATARTRPQPYYLRLTKDGEPNAGTTYNIGDSGPDGRRPAPVVDPSFLELVRLGVKRADDPAILNTLARRRPAARRRRRPTAVLAPLQLRRLRRDEGRRDVGHRAPGEPDRRLGAQHDDRAHLAALRAASAASTSWRPASRPRRARRWPRWPAPRARGHMIPEQVWDQFPPSGDAAASRAARRRSRRRRWRGRTRSSCAWPGRSTRATRSSGRAWSSSATAASPSARASRTTSSDRPTTSNTPASSSSAANRSLIPPGVAYELRSGRRPRPRRRRSTRRSARPPRAARRARRANRRSRPGTAGAPRSCPRPPTSPRRRRRPPRRRHRRAGRTARRRPRRRDGPG